MPTSTELEPVESFPTVSPTACRTVEAEMLVSIVVIVQRAAGPTRLVLTLSEAKALAAQLADLVAAGSAVADVRPAALAKLAP